MDRWPRIIVVPLGLAILAGVLLILAAVWAGPVLRLWPPADVLRALVAGFALIGTAVILGGCFALVTDLLKPR